MITTIFTLFCFLVVVLTSVPEQVGAMRMFSVGCLSFCQVHLSSTGQREITVTWVSQNETSTVAAFETETNHLHTFFFQEHFILWRIPWKLFSESFWRSGSVFWHVNCNNIRRHRISYFSIDLGPMNRKIFIHRAVLTNLIPHNTYYYVVGDGNGKYSLVFFHNNHIIPFLVFSYE